MQMTPHSQSGRVYAAPAAQAVPLLGRTPLCISGNIQDYTLEYEFNWD